MTTNPTANFQGGNRETLPPTPNRGGQTHPQPFQSGEYPPLYDQGQGQGQVPQFPQGQGLVPQPSPSIGRANFFPQMNQYNQSDSDTAQKSDYYARKNGDLMNQNQDLKKQYYVGYGQEQNNTYKQQYEGNQLQQQQLQQQQQYKNNNNNNNITTTNNNNNQQAYCVNGSVNGVQQQQQQQQNGGYPSQMYQMQQMQGGMQGQQQYGGGEYVAESWETEQVEQQMQRMQIREPIQSPPMYFSPNKMMSGAENGNVEQEIPQEVLKRQQALEIKLENVDQEIVRALRDPKNTKTVLSYESSVIEFVNNQVLPFMEFEENANSYLKLLAHRIAQRFGLHTTTQKLGEKRGFVKAERTAETCLPKYLLVDILNEMQMISNVTPPQPNNPSQMDNPYQQQPQQYPQYALLQRRNYSEPVTPRARSYMMQQGVQQQQQQQQQGVGRGGGVGAGVVPGGGLWEAKTAAARDEMYDQARERIFNDKEDQEQQQVQEPRRGTKAILKNKQEEKMDPDYQRNSNMGQRYRNKQFDMGKMQAEYYNTPMAYDQHFPPLASDMTAHRSPSWPFTAQDVPTNNQMPPPHMQHPYYYQQWSPGYPPHVQMQQPPYQPTIQGGGAVGGGAAQYVPAAFPQVHMVVGRPGATYIAASPFQGPPPPQLMDTALRKPSNEYPIPAIPPQQSPALYVPAQMTTWNAQPNQMNNPPQGVYQDVGRNYDVANQGMSVGVGRKQSYKKSQMAQLPAEIDGTIEHKMSLTGEEQ